MQFGRKDKMFDMRFVDDFRDMLQKEEEVSKKLREELKEIRAVKVQVERKDKKVGRVQKVGSRRSERLKLKP